MAQVTSIPVFVFPPTIKFILNGRSNHKELLTVYNPYDFAIKYKICSTCHIKYTISDPEGIIGPKCSFDIVIKHNVPTISNCGTVDKFRITICDKKTQKITGKHSIEVILLECDDDISLDSHRDFLSMPRGTESTRSRDRSMGREQFYANRIKDSKKTFVFIVSIAAIAILVVLPLKDTGEINEQLPDYLHLTCYSKIAISFFIGAISTYYLFSFHTPSRTNVI